MMTRKEFRKHITGKTVYVKAFVRGHFPVVITKQTAMELWDHCDGDVTLWIHDGYVGVEGGAKARHGMAGWIIWEPMP